MSGANAINWGYNPSLNADQYYQQYMQWSQALDQQAAAKAATQSGQATQGTANPIFQGGAPVQAAQQKESHTGRNILLFTGATAAILAGVAMHNGGGIRNAFKNKEVFSSMKKGFSNMWNGIKGSTNGSTVQEVSKKIKKPETLSVTKQTSKTGNVITTCTIPNQINRSSGLKVQGTVAEQARKIGMDTISFTSKNVPEGAVVKEYAYKYSVGKNTYTLHVRNGKLCKILSPDGKEIRTKLLQSTKQTDINLLERLQNSVPTDIKEAAKLKDYVVKLYQYKKDGVAALFRPNSKGSFELSAFVTDKFALNSDMAKAYSYQHPEAKELFDAIKKGNTKNLRIASADVFHSKGTFKIKNGEIVGITEKGVYYPSTDAHFIALKSDNEKLFEDILRNQSQYKNISYCL